jgi:mono/diheme cytochrome c family protein
MINILKIWRLRAASTAAKRRSEHWVFRISILFAISAVTVVAVTAVTGPTTAAQSKTVWDGVYTQQQAERGALSFASNCARCHEASANDGEEGKNLAGKVFWQSFRESTVDHLLDYVSRNMPNGAGGTLGATTYADLVAYILSRNDLPAGATELSKESAVGVKIIAKDGPGEIPGGTLVRVVGCLARREGGGWILNSATAPERPNPAADADDAARRLGTRSYALMFALTPLDRYVGHRLRVRGLLIGDGGRDGINVSVTQSLAESCS